MPIILYFSFYLKNNIFGKPTSFFVSSNILTSVVRRCGKDYLFSTFIAIYSLLL